MTIAEVTPGVCGLGTLVVATHDETTGQVSLVLETDCAAIRRLAAVLTAVDAYQTAFTPAPGNPVYVAAGEARLHPSCALPTAIIKAVEVAAGLALPRDVTIRLTKS
ncbi:MAG: hypothetical protein HY321_20995 [Armatimonadetes bacterium]|nr:hypothetical protein [Armatimonadota bacterium]